MYYFPVATKNFIWDEEEFQKLTSGIDFFQKEKQLHQAINIGTSAEPAGNKNNRAEAGSLVRDRLMIHNHPQTRIVIIIII